MKFSLYFTHLPRSSRRRICSKFGTAVTRDSFFADGLTGVDSVGWGWKFAHFRAGALQVAPTLLLNAATLEIPLLLISEEIGLTVECLRFYRMIFQISKAMIFQRKGFSSSPAANPSSF